MIKKEINKHISRFQKPFLFLLSVQIISLLSFSFIPFYFRSHGLSSVTYILLFAIATLLASLSILFVKVIYPRTYLIIGYLFYSILSFVFLINNLMLVYYLYLIIIVIVVIFYWPTINYLFFSNSSKETHATDSYFYGIFASFLSIIIPPISGYIILKQGYSFVYCLGGILFIIPLIFSYFLVSNTPIYLKSHDKPFFQRIKDNFKEYKGLKLITFLDGGIPYLSAVIIPVFSLTYFSNTKDYGIFLSYLGILAAVFSFFISKLSDKLQKRKWPVVLSAILLAIAVISMSFVSDVKHWYIVIGFFTVVTVLSGPIRFAIQLDSKDKGASFWITREFFMNFGRAIFMFIAFLIFYLGYSKYIFYFFFLVALFNIWAYWYKLRNIN
ncbi:MAG: MFS transporter [Candidatus Woesearchaeota archaeon]|jgi:MFS family permease